MPSSLLEFNGKNRTQLGISDELFPYGESVIPVLNKDAKMSDLAHQAAKRDIDYFFRKSCSQLSSSGVATPTSSTG